MADKKVSVQALASKKALQILIALLFITLGIIGFSSNKGIGASLSNELSKMFGNGDQELLLYVISTVELLCGVFLLAALFVKAIPANIVKLSMTAVWIVWIAIIVVLDILTVDFGKLEGVRWFVWLEQIVMHLIVLAGILKVQEN
jgi:hypothetical protein